MTRPPRKAYRKVIAGAAAVAIALATACAPRPLTLPSGPGIPMDAAEATAAYAEGAQSCGSTRTLTAELAVSGKAGRMKLRGRVLAGFERPDAIRLEGLAPFGAPAFVFVAKGGRATLLLPRDNRVLRDAPPAEIVEALMGIPLDPASLGAALSGCGVPVAEIIRGRRYGDDQIAIELGSGATVYFARRASRWRVIAAVASGGDAKAAYTVEYPDASGERPSRVRVRTGPGAPVTADVSVGLSQVDINTDLDPATFEVEVPKDAVPITIDDLRATGPLGQKS